MTSKNRAIHIGRTEAVKAVTIGLLTAQLIMMLTNYRKGFVGSFLWFSDFNYQINLVIAIAAFYLCGYIFGGMAGTAILIRRWNYLWTGFFYGLLILITATFLASWTAFFQEGITEMNENGTPFNDYIFKPVFWVTGTGLVPVLVVGFWFGFSIYRKRKISG